MMLIKFWPFSVKYLLKGNGKSFQHCRNGRNFIMKRSFSATEKELNNMNKRNEAIVRHMKKEYDIDSDSLNIDVEIKNGKKNIYEISKLWCKFFKCDKSFFNVVNKYLKTGKSDVYLHNFLCCDNLGEKKEETGEMEKEENRVRQTEKDKKKDEKKDKKDKQKEEKICKSSNTEIVIEEQANHVLIYLMTYFCKNIRDFNTISLLTEKLKNLLNALQVNYQNKQFLFHICEVYNYLHAMDDELFTLVFNKIHNIFSISVNENVEENEKNKKGNKRVEIKDDELILILRTLYIQKYKNHNIVDFLIHYLKNEKNLSFTSEVLINSFFYLSLLNRLDTTLLKLLESQIFTIVETENKNDKESEHIEKEEESLDREEKEKFVNGNNNAHKLKKNSELNTMKRINIETKINLTVDCCSKLLYSYFLLGENHINLFFISKLLMILCEKAEDETIFKKNQKMHERICIIRSYLKYNKRDIYKGLEKSIKRKLKEIYYFDMDSEKKINERTFVDKMSWHLKKLRIPHLKNVYKKGIIFDIIEKDQKLVWFCFSYHNYYVRTIDLTAEKKLQMEIVKAMKYKIAKTHYYQFSRMKARKTRFEYIRMCRYYSLRDRRNFAEAELEGWSLPYINWYHKKNKNVHVSNYFYNYKPLSEVEY